MTEWPSLTQLPEVWLLENSMKHETWTKDKAGVRFMPLTAVVFTLFQIEEVETTAADLFLVLGMGVMDANTMETQRP